MTIIDYNDFGIEGADFIYIGPLPQKEGIYLQVYKGERCILKALPAEKFSDLEIKGLPEEGWVAAEEPSRRIQYRISRITCFSLRGNHIEVAHNGLRSHIRLSDKSVLFVNGRKISDESNGLDLYRDLTEALPHIRRSNGIRLVTRKGEPVALYVRGRFFNGDRGERIIPVEDLYGVEYDYTVDRGYEIKIITSDEIIKIRLDQEPEAELFEIPGISVFSPFLQAGDFRIIAFRYKAITEVKDKKICFGDERRSITIPESQEMNHSWREGLETLTHGQAVVFARQNAEFNKEEVL